MTKTCPVLQVEASAYEDLLPKELSSSPDLPAKRRIYGDWLQEKQVLIISLLMNKSNIQYNTIHQKRIEIHLRILGYKMYVYKWKWPPLYHEYFFNFWINNSLPSRSSIFRELWNNWRIKGRIGEGIEISWGSIFLLVVAIIALD